jgi:hypothetical protein
VARLTAELAYFSYRGLALISNAEEIKIINVR